MVALAGARSVHERGAVRGQRRGHEDKDHEEEAEELFHISITTKDTISESGGGKQHKAMQRKGGVSGVEEKLEELEETVDAMRKELIRLRWKAEALETAVAVLAGLAGAFLVTAVRLLLR